mmetsp:Transcript_77311/g.214921  ORF Transcript_77311/g.214921 Transcript_77311/m.214921 type:complete len:439 (-) Transcript_77311:174-1490(-)
MIGNGVFLVSAILHFHALPAASSGAVPQQLRARPANQTALNLTHGKAAQSEPVIIQHVAKTQFKREQRALVTDRTSSWAMFSDMLMPRLAGESVPGIMAAYIITMIGTAITIVLFFWQKGLRVMFWVTMYLYALSTMMLSVKWLYIAHGFKYPAFVIFMHMLSSAGVGFAVMLKQRIDLGTPVVVPTVSEFFFKIVPISATIALSLASNNSALLYCNASFAEIMGATAPIFSAFLTILMGMPFDPRLFMPMGIVVFGCTLSVTGELAFSSLGLFLCLFSSFTRSLKGVLQQDLMTGAMKAKFDPVTLLAWSSVSSSIIMFFWSVAIDGIEPVTKLLDPMTGAGTVFALIVSCANACMVNLAALLVTKDLGAVGAQIVGQLKSVLVVMGSVAVFHDALSKKDMFGFVFVLVGTFTFSRMSEATKHIDAPEEKPLLKQNK